jgi:archaemetzincin
MAEWLGERKKISAKAKRRVVYVAAPPSVSADAPFINDWTTPCSMKESKHSASGASAPNTQDAVEYLEAFYHGVPVQMLPTPLTFALWEDGGPRPAKRARTKAKSSQPKYISLQTSTSATRIRTRVDPNGTFPKQLCLDDILDCAIGDLLPSDAYALLLLTDHDLYEGEEDDFCCGRAYGGSRVAVVSTARYRPEMDRESKVEREHAWPASHCKEYVEGVCCAHEEEGGVKQKGGKRRKAAEGKSEGADPSHSAALNSPLALAVRAHVGSLSSISTSISSRSLSELWLSRVCRTAAHELGHCFGMDHCVYYACSMQGTASLVEDARQPPYLCPVDLAKLMAAVGGDGETIKARYRALKEYCTRHEGTPLFDSYAAWIRGRLEDIG